MVRLKVVFVVVVFAGCAVFQFHYGSVKRQDTADGKRRVFDFNSTMVRLKATTADEYDVGDLISIPLWFG